MNLSVHTDIIEVPVSVGTGETTSSRDCVKVGITQFRFDTLVSKHLVISTSRTASIKNNSLIVMTS